MYLASHILFESELVRVVDVGCQAPRSGYGTEEPVESPRLIFPRRGVFECRRAGKTVVADSNTVLLMNGGDVCRIGHPVDGGDDCSVMVFPPELLAEAVRAGGRPADRPFAARHAILDAGLQYTHRWFHHALCHRPDVDPLGIEEAGGALLLQLAHRLQARPPDRVSGPTQALRRKRIERARSLLASQPAAPWTLADLARLLHCSPFHLARMFRAEIGLSLHQYRLRLRHGLALERLAQGEEDLARLAVDLGFGSHSHFSASFRQIFGQPPSRLRRQLTRRRWGELSRILTAAGPRSR